ncbi:hypothetical protein JXO59_00055, partial [candidate division KSB1 bacterium]|nr:hypothetical protein [candidate division KSB1 bacterium]
IALFPCEEWKNLPQPQARNTFDRYFDYFQRRLQPDFNWQDFTPYEIRLIGAFIRMGERERAHTLLQFFMDCRRPAGWNHWAEVVWREKRAPRFIGDMPHTWVGSDFIHSLRAMFVYEDEASQQLIVAAGLPSSWIDSPQGIGVRNLPTYWGSLDFSITNSGGIYRVVFSGEVVVPAGGLIIVSWLDKKPEAVKVDGQLWPQFDEREIRIHDFPCTVEIYP